MILDTRTKKYAVIGLIAALLVSSAVFLYYYKPSRVTLFRKAVSDETATPVSETNTTGKAGKLPGIAFKGDTSSVLSDQADPDKVIQFARKAACRLNTTAINSAVELWYMTKGGQWPKDDLSDIGRDRDFFPSGIPVCPVTGAPYRLDPVSHRVVGHSHNDIQDLTIPGEEVPPPATGTPQPAPVLPGAPSGTGR